MMLNAMNAKRYDHVVKKLTVDQDVVTKLYKQVMENKADKWDDPKSRPAITGPGSDKYIELWYHSTDIAALNSRGYSVKGWYAGNELYDFKYDYNKEVANA
jgi:hypothetical protein